MKRFFSIFILVLLLSSMLTSCGLQVPRPEIKNGEFEFSVTYELNGEIKTVSSVYVCEYAGTDWALDGGYHRTWTAYVEGGEDNLSHIGTTEDGGNIKIYFGFYPEYFMGDPLWSWMGTPEPSLSVIHIDGEAMAVQNEADVIEELYGVKIISYEYDEPIENTFGLFK